MDALAGAVQRRMTMRLFDVDELKENHGKMMIFEVTGSVGGEQMSDYNIRIQKPSEDFDSCSDCIHAADSKEICILRRCVHAIAELKECYEQKQPERKRGRWIRQRNKAKPLYGWFFCSECGAFCGGETNFCSECGADMREVDDERV